MLPQAVGRIELLLRSSVTPDRRAIYNELGIFEAHELGLAAIWEMVAGLFRLLLSQHVFDRIDRPLLSARQNPYA